jgi:Mitochondrial fission ELM1
VFTTLTAPHSFTARRLAELRRTMPPAIAALPRPRVSVILGGKNAVYKFRNEDDKRLARSLRSLGQLGVSFLITPSRRTHDRLRRVVEEATRAFPRIFWDGEGPNPYGDFLAHGDLFVVTADSVNMVGEACATGKPVLVFTPGGGSAKFRRFHAALQARGATRPLPDKLDAIPQWSYAPLFSDDEIAREIERRRLLSGWGKPGQGHMPAAASSAMAENTARTAASGIPNGTLCAGGTLALRPLTLARGLWLLIEMALIYLGIPFLVELAVPGYHVPVFIALLPVLAIILVLLLIDPAFSLRRELSCGFALLTFVILAVFAIGGGAVAHWVAQHHPDWFLEFPRNRPDTYWTIMLLYPLMSVPPGARLSHVLLPPLRRAVCARLVAGHPGQR